jgi:Mn2+/Fe2+ NRAMP family transporter
MAVRVPWWDVLRGAVVPTVIWSPQHLTAVVASFGATINPYLFFWQASQEVEEQESTPREAPLRRAPEQAPAQIRRIKLDTYTGMAYSNAIAFFVMLTTASTLHARGITSITSAAQAAEALRPVAGEFAFCTMAAACRDS